MRPFLVRVGLLSLLTLPAWAQQPALPSAPQPTTSPSPAETVPTTLPTSESAPPTGPSTEIIGQTYSIELRSGSSFAGVLQAATTQELIFATRDLGVVTVQRLNLRQFVLLTPEQARQGYNNVGNGTRLFFAPTARNLRRGEGYVQDIAIFLVGANYGITDNISVGVLVPIIPGLGLNVLAITPKVSFAVADNFHVGAGALYATAFGSSGGIGYGVVTYGSADTNVTVGLGYAFAQGEVSSTPVVVVGGALRVLRRLSFIEETYIVDGGLGGLIGARVASSRVSGSLGLLYATRLGGIYPAYADIVYRFGKVK